jgi:predicted nucleic acid-binding protein
VITAVDTNVLLDVLRPNPDFLEASVEALVTSGGEGKLVICDIVYAELCVHFTDRKSCDGFLRDRRIGVQSLTRSGCDFAARAWKKYREAGGPRERILPDFLIGAHAQTRSSRLLTRDRGFYRTYFSDLALINLAPAKGSASS